MRVRVLMPLALATTALAIAAEALGAPAVGVVPKPGEHTGQTLQNFGKGERLTPAFYYLDVDGKRRITSFQTDFECGGETPRVVYYGRRQETEPEAGIPSLPFEPIQIERAGSRKGAFHARFQAPWRFDPPHADIKLDGVATVVLTGQWRNPPGPAAPVLFGKVSVKTDDCTTGVVKLYAYN